MEVDDGSEEEIATWRQRLLAAPDFDARGDLLNQLRRLDRDAFLALCRALAADSEPALQLVGLLFLGYYGDRDDSRADDLARARLETSDPELRNAAILALGTVAVSSTFPLLLASAAEGYYLAFRAAAKQARTPDQQRQLRDLAREGVLSEISQVRWHALWALEHVSTPAEEEDLLLESARRYLDELTFAALRHATPRVLPALREMLRAYPEGSAQHLDISDAIQAIQQQVRNV